MDLLKKIVRETGLLFLKIVYPRLYILEKKNAEVGMLIKNISASEISPLANIGSPSQISCSKIGDYTYVSINSFINMANIGKFCSIGPNFFCGWGIHPTDGLSTSPAFFSTNNQVGMSFSNHNKIEERKTIEIGNDVFIGMNVTVIDGVKIGDGAIIGAGAVVSKDIPPYAIAVGSPIKIIRYRMNVDSIRSLQEIKWWDFDTDNIKEVEKYFYNVDDFIAKYKK